MKRGPEERQAYMKNLRPLIGGLFNAAHAITGSSEMAEYVAQEAILAAYLQLGKWRGRMGFREGMMRALRDRALDHLRRQRAGELDWRAFSAEDESRAIALLAAQPPEIQRAAVLRYGCGLSYRQIGWVMHLPADQLRDGMRQMFSRVERALKSPDRHAKPIEREIATEIRRHMNRVGGAAFDPGTMMRTFEQDVEGMRRPRRIMRRTIRVLTTAIGALICAALFWLLAILLEG